MELLVVLGIIVLLLAILLPALSIARRSARNANCQSNLRQLGQATQMALNQEELFPFFVIGLPASAAIGRVSAQTALESYLDDPMILICPADAGPSANLRGADAWTAVSYFYIPGIMMNFEATIFGNDRIRRRVTSFYRGTPGPVFVDGDARHNGYRNKAFYPDWRVERAKEPPEAEADGSRSARR